VKRAAVAILAGAAVLPAAPAAVKTGFGHAPSGESWAEPVASYSGITAEPGIADIWELDPVKPVVRLTWWGTFRNYSPSQPTADSPPANFEGDFDVIFCTATESGGLFRPGTWNHLTTVFPQYQYDFTAGTEGAYQHVFRFSAPVDPEFAPGPETAYFLVLQANYTIDPAQYPWCWWPGEDAGPEPPVYSEVVSESGSWVELSAVAAGMAFEIQVPRPPTQGDFDGDGTADVAVFRGSAGLWAVRGVTRIWYGETGDLPLPGNWISTDYWSPAVGRARDNGYLWLVRGNTRAYFGLDGDLPVPADYDGDGIWDIALYRPATGLWTSKSPIFRFYFGNADDVPVPADYDGDRLGDPAVFGGDGRWAVRGRTRFYFGTAADAAVPDDYDGDGSADPAVFRNVSGLWAVRSISRVYFGGQTDLPAPADYDGDGTADVAVFRRGYGLWLLRSLSRVYFGGWQDTPANQLPRF